MHECNHKFLWPFLSFALALSPWLGEWVFVCSALLFLFCVRVLCAFPLHFISFALVLMCAREPLLIVDTRFKAICFFLMCLSAVRFYLILSSSFVLVRRTLFPLLLLLLSANVWAQASNEKYRMVFGGFGPFFIRFLSVFLQLSFSPVCVFLHTLRRGFVKHSNSKIVMKSVKDTHNSLHFPPLFFFLCANCSHNKIHNKNSPS